MKCFIQLLCVLSVFCAVSTRSILQHSRPARNGMIFYQAAPGYYRPRQHAMFVQYEAKHPLRSSGRRRQAEEGAVAAFASGGTISAQTYLKDCKHTDGDFDSPVYETQQPALVRIDDENIQSFAEAYPKAPLEQGDQILPTAAIEQNDEPSLNEVIPQDFVQSDVPEVAAEAPKEIETSIPVVQEEVLNVTPPAITEVAINQPSSTKPQTRISLDEDEDDDDDGVEESYSPFHPSTALHRKGHGSPGNIFFPISFGSTSGGAIAVANSFSTGKRGTATSHATAYGSPSKSRN